MTLWPLILWTLRMARTPWSQVSMWAGQSVFQGPLEELLLASTVNKDGADPTSLKGNIPFLQLKGGIREELQRGNRQLRAHPMCELALPVTTA